MANNVIFKLFRTYNHPYLYDRHTNSLAVLSEDEYKELGNVKQGNFPEIESNVIRKYQEYGMMNPNVVEKIEHPLNLLVESYLKNRLNHLILQVTQQCNLRCTYCQFSGNYYERYREHTSRSMSWDTAKTAIDFYLARSRELPDITIGFFGGEPLLEFELIKKCVDYVSTQIEGRKATFTITTNGTLLTDSIIAFLAKHEFQLAISLDGSKDDHDATRKFPNGRGTFDLIMDNINKIQKEYPEFDKNTGILATFNPRMDIDCSLTYFNSCKVFENRMITYNPMNESDLTQELHYNDKHHLVTTYEYIKMLCSLVGKLDASQISPLMNNNRVAINSRYRQLHNRSTAYAVMHHSGPCMPGVKRMFVNVDGDIFPCERVSETKSYFNIGNICTGFDLEKIRQILNHGQLSERECSNCWALRQCTQCVAEVSFDVEPTKEDKLRKCGKGYPELILNLYEMAVLCEFGFTAEGLR